MSEPDNDYRPTVDDVDPSALAVNSIDDHVRVSADPSETEIIDSGGETLRVDEGSDGDRVLLPEDSGDESDSEAPGGTGGQAAQRPVDETVGGRS